MEVPVGPVTLSVRRGGDDTGQSIVFLHGCMMSSAFWIYQLDSPELRRFNLIAPDFRGHGESERVASGHTVPTYARDIVALLDELEVVDPILVGWSMGAMVLWEYIRARKDAVRGAVVVDQSPADYTWGDYPFGFCDIAGLAQIVDRLQTDREGFLLDLALMMQYAPQAMRTAWMVHEIAKLAPTVASTIFVDQSIRDYRADLPGLIIPTLLLFGRDPKVMKPEAGAYMADLIPGSELRVFEDSGHCPFIEEAAAFNNELAAFADRLSRADT